MTKAEIIKTIDDNFPQNWAKKNLLDYVSQALDRYEQAVRKDEREQIAKDMAKLTAYLHQEKVINTLEGHDL